ncbi:FMN-dependent NADH-azoreductase, partial [Endothiovibrio diazotrophicus]
MSRTILHIDSSARREGSTSRELGRRFIARWKQHHPEDRVVERDLGAAPLPHLDETLLAAFFTPAEQHAPAVTEAATRADALIDELFAADVVVIGAPMYNFGVPSTLKAYIDHIARAGRTFRYGERGPEGLVLP